MSHCKQYRREDFNQGSSSQNGPAALVAGTSCAKRNTTDTHASDPAVEQRRLKRLAALDAQLRTPRKNQSN